MAQWKWSKWLRAVFPFGTLAGAHPETEAQDNRSGVAPEVNQAGPDQTSGDELANLPPEERQRRSERQQQYERFAQRMRLVEAEDQANRQREP